MGGQVLESSRQEKDLGVLIDEGLKPSAHCAKAASKGNMILGQLTRACTWRDPGNLTKLYKVYVRPHLEYAQTSCAPWHLGDIEVIEKVQQRFTRMVSGMGHMSYPERLATLGLTTLQTRREMGDMIETYKVDVNASTWFTLLNNREGAASTRGTSGYLNLERRDAKLDLRLNQFSIRVVISCNSLPDNIKSQETLNGFKNAYDNYKR